MKDIGFLDEKKQKDYERYWVFRRKESVRAVFKDRKEAVKYFKEMLKQTLKDFENQDKFNCGYDYKIEIPYMVFEEIDYRDSDMSLL